jgi:hypothetical protein
MALQDKIKNTDMYVYIRSRKAQPSLIDAYVGKQEYKKRQIVHTFNEHIGGEYFAYITSKSGNSKLLIPPLDSPSYDFSGACDIKEFAEQEPKGWSQLFDAIEEHWKNGKWVSTEGHAVAYLHIRFESKSRLPDGPRLFVNKTRLT